MRNAVSDKVRIQDRLTIIEALFSSKDFGRDGKKLVHLVQQKKEEEKDLKEIRTGALNAFMQSGILRIVNRKLCVDRRYGVLLNNLLFKGSLMYLEYTDHTDGATKEMDLGEALISMDRGVLVARSGQLHSVEEPAHSIDDVDPDSLRGPPSDAERIHNGHFGADEEIGDDLDFGPDSLPRVLAPELVRKAARIAGVSDREHHDAFMP